MGLFSIFGSEGDESSYFAKNHPVGFLKIPAEIDTLPSLGVAQRFIAPNTIDERPRCTKTEDQGSNPWCAAYAATQFAENVLWRKRGFVEDIDPAKIYSYAKSVDGDPNGSGTTIPAVFRALTNYGYFDSGKCPVRIVRNGTSDIKYALHRFGVLLGGFNITSEWYKCNRRKTAICSKTALPGIGGHCVLICGYNKDGVYILNSWGKEWGEYGYALISWKCFQEQFIYGGILDNCLNDITL